MTRTASPPTASARPCRHPGPDPTRPGAPPTFERTAPRRGAVLSRGRRGGDGNRTRVKGFADLCLSHSATPPERISVPCDPTNGSGDDDSTAGSRRGRAVPGGWRRLTSRRRGDVRAGAARGRVPTRRRHADARLGSGDRRARRGGHRGRRTSTPSSGARAGRRSRTARASPFLAAALGCSNHVGGTLAVGIDPRRHGRADRRAPTPSAPARRRSRSSSPPTPCGPGPARDSNRVAARARPRSCSRRAVVPRRSARASRAAARSSTATAATARTTSATSTTRACSAKRSSCRSSAEVTTALASFDVRTWSLPDPDGRLGATVERPIVHWA